MTAKIPFAVLSPDPRVRAQIAERIEDTGALTVATQAECPEELERALRRNPGLGLYVDLGPDADKALGWLEGLAEPRPPILAGGPEAPDLILRAMRAGAVAYFPAHELDEELDRAAARLLALPHAEEMAGAGTVTAVIGAKGGVGATTVACELAAQLSKTGGRVALLDAKPYFGDVALHLDLDPGHSLADAAARGDELDAAYLETIAELHGPTGIHVVAAPGDPEDGESVMPAHVERVARLLQADFDHVVLDLPRMTDDISLHVFEWADRVVLVSSESLTSMARARQKLALLSALGVPDDAIRVILNRCANGGVFEDDAAESAGLDPVARVPRDASIVESVPAGRPVCSGAGRSNVASAFEALAQSLDGGATHAEEAADSTLGGWAQRAMEELKCRFASA